MTVVAILGAPGSGKSTLAWSLARHLSMRLVCLDEIRQDRGRRWGYSTARADRIFDESGAEALHRYDSKFELFVLEEVLEHLSQGVIDCSGGLVLQHTDEYRTRLNQALARIDSVVIATAANDKRDAVVDALVRRLRNRTDDPHVEEWTNRGGRNLLSRLEDAGALITHGDTHRVVMADGADTDSLAGSLGERILRRHASCSTKGGESA
ncbi:hypothetical protein FEK35_13695 [Nocardia cyriacigeorgica]|uniref:AAA family ATPase n=1 Tax=Nocardia cyriacigeorgica TaxID=135487 RepID=A0A5R8PDG5_9NOCA|nr:shikimate kinase [Nocardia cyriacigeorgica]TLG10251.1 hypothetical protein FEK35_13695 [Nocardia cyriacigeorgica]